MSVENLVELPERGGGSSDLSAIGAVFLHDIVDVGKLPVRLRGDFADRPWPVHDIEARLVDRALVPNVPAVQSEAAWTLQIVDDCTLLVDETERRLRGSPLMLLNLMLLTRDWSLRGDELHALGFASHLTTPKATQLFDLALQRLRQRVAQKLIFHNEQRVHSGAYRLNPAMRVVDWRGF